MDIYTREVLEKYIKSSQSISFRKRYCFEDIKRYMTEDNRRVLCLYGLRRTGKSTLMDQMIHELDDYNDSILIKCEYGDTMQALKAAIRESNSKYIFIDEATNIDNFQNTCSWFADELTHTGKKVVLSGTNSYGFALAECDELYDRAIMIPTTFIPFREYHELLGKNLEQYIEYGGTLTDGNVFYNKDSTLKYTNSAIADNIAFSISRWKGGRHSLYSVYETGELATYIRKVVELHNRTFLASTINRAFQSHDLGSLADLATKYEFTTVPLKEKELESAVRNALHIREPLTEVATEQMVGELTDILEKMDILVPMPGNEIRFPKEYIFTQPGLRYSQISDTSEILTNSPHMAAYSNEERLALSKFLSNDIKGRMLEDIIMSDLLKDPAVSKDFEIGKFRNRNNYEFDITLINRKTRCAALFEVKHSEKRAKEQGRFLRDTEFCEEFEIACHCRVTGKYVIYNGPSGAVYGVKYLNSSEFLKHEIVFTNLIKKLQTQDIVQNQSLQHATKNLSQINECPNASFEEI